MSKLNDPLYKILHYNGNTPIIDDIGVDMSGHGNDIQLTPGSTLEFDKHSKYALLFKDENILGAHLYGGPVPNTIPAAVGGKYIRNSLVGKYKYTGAPCISLHGSANRNVRASKPIPGDFNKLTYRFRVRDSVVNNGVVTTLMSDPDNPDWWVKLGGDHLISFSTGPGEVSFKDFNSGTGKGGDSAFIPAGWATLTIRSQPSGHEITVDTQSTRNTAEGWGSGNTTTFRPLLGSDPSMENPYRGEASLFYINTAFGEESVLWDFSTAGGDIVHDLATNTAGVQQLNHGICHRDNPTHTTELWTGTDYAPHNALARGYQWYTSSNGDPTLYVPPDDRGQRIAIDIPAGYTDRGFIAGGVFHNGCLSGVSGVDSYLLDSFIVTIYNEDYSIDRNYVAVIQPSEYGPPSWGFQLLNGDEVTIKIPNVRNKVELWYAKKGEASIRVQDIYSFPSETLFPPTGGYGAEPEFDYVPWMTVLYSHPFIGAGRLVSRSYDQMQSDTINGIYYTKGMSGGREIISSVRFDEGTVQPSVAQTDMLLNINNFSLIAGLTLANDYTTRDRPLFEKINGYLYDIKLYLKYIDAYNRRLCFIDTNGIEVHGRTDITSDKDFLVGMTYDGSIIKLYVDGVLDNQLAYNTVWTDTEEGCYIGGNGIDNFRGLLSELQIFSTALSPADMSQAYDNSIARAMELDTTNSDQNLVFYSTDGMLDKANGATIINNGATVGMGMSFNKGPDYITTPEIIGLSTAPTTARTSIVSIDFTSLGYSDDIGIFCEFMEDFSDVGMFAGIKYGSQIAYGISQNTGYYETDLDLTVGKYRIATTYDPISNIVMLYINGVKVHELLCTESVVTSRPFGAVFGTDLLGVLSNDLRQMHGTIENVSLFIDTKSPAYITNDYKTAVKYW